MFNPRAQLGSTTPPPGADSVGVLNLSSEALERRLRVSQSRAANRSHEGRPWISDPVLRAARLRAEILYGAAN